MSDAVLRELVDAIVAGDSALVSQLLAESPQLARGSFREGATRQTAQHCYLKQIHRYFYAGDTALHVAAGAYRLEIVRALIAAGADVQAKNRLGDEPLHAAAAGQPGSRTWNPEAQAATIVSLIEAGADPDATDKRGVTPLHRGVRTRCAAAVRALLDHGADPARKNKNGSSPVVLAKMTTGRGGSGSDEAKAQQRQILRLLEERLGLPSKSSQ
jgi:ankyrin repeat protein